VANIAATSPTSFCSGALCAVNVTATPFVGNYTYFIFYGTMSSNSTNPNFGVNVAATVKAMVTDNNTGCSSKQSSSSVKTTVIATPVPTITASGSTAISSTGSVKLNAAPTAGVSWLWYKDGNLIVGATGKTYIATTAGSYTVAVTKTGCTGMSAATVVTQNTQKTETNNIETSFRLNAYPNPVEDVVNISIETDGQTVEGNLEVVNSLGQKVAEKTITSTTPCQLSTANWTNGVYFIRYKDNEGRTGTIKITKQ
jgi:hypothetical protein